MPIYEYQCAHCGTRSDHLMRVSDPDPTECPGCDQPQLSRLLSAPQFRLAGGGWYETDFKGDKDKKRNLATSSDASGGGSTSAGGDSGGTGGTSPTTSSSSSTAASGSGGAGTSTKKDAAA